MIEAGEVGAVFTVVDEASVILQRLARQFKELDALVLGTKKQLASFGNSAGLGKLSGEIAAAGRELSTIGGAAELAAAKAGASFDKLDVAVNASIDRVAVLKNELRSLGRIPGGGTAALPGGSIRNGGRGGGGGRNGEPHLSAESPTIRTPLGNVRAEGGNIWEGLGILAVFDLIKHAYTYGGELETQKKLLHDLLGSREKPGEFDSALSAAIAYSTNAQTGVMGSTPASNLAGLREIYPFMPDLQAAIKELPPLMQAARLLEEMTHGEKKAETQLPLLAKAMENLGGGIDPNTHELSPERMGLAISEAVKTIIAGGGTIDAAALLAFAKQAGGMGRITTDLPTMFDNIITSILDMGGNRAGTALAALGRQFLGGQMSPQKAEELESLGILPKGQWHKAGAGIALSPGAKMLGEDEIKDPTKGMANWIQDVWGPAVMKKLGPNAGLPDVMQESIKDFGTATGQRIALLFYANAAQVERDKLIRNSVDPQNAYSGMITNDLAANTNNFSAAITGLGQVLGGPSTQAAISGLQLLTGAIHKLTEAAAVSPSADKTLLEGGTIAALMAGAGWISKLFGGPGVSKLLGPVGTGFAAYQTTVDLGEHIKMLMHDLGSGKAIPPPVVNNETKVENTITLDGAAIAAKVVTRVQNQLRTINGTSGIDSGAHWSPPDMGK